MNYTIILYIKQRGCFKYHTVRPYVWVEVGGRLSVENNTFILFQLLSNFFFLGLCKRRGRRIRYYIFYFYFWNNDFLVDFGAKIYTFIHTCQCYIISEQSVLCSGEQLYMYTYIYFQGRIYSFPYGVPGQRGPQKVSKLHESLFSSDYVVLLYLEIRKTWNGDW